MNVCIRIKAKNVANALKKLTSFLSSYGCSYEYAYVFFLSISNLVSVLIYISFLLTFRPKDFFESRLNRRYFCTTYVCAKCLKNDLFLLVYFQMVNFYNSWSILASVLLDGRFCSVHKILIFYRAPKGFNQLFFASFPFFVGEGFFAVLFSLHNVNISDSFTKSVIYVSTWNLQITLMLWNQVAHFISDNSSIIKWGMSKSEGIIKCSIKIFFRSCCVPGIHFDLIFRKIIWHYIKKKSNAVRFIDILGIIKRVLNFVNLLIMNKNEFVNVAGSSGFGRARN